MMKILYLLDRPELGGGVKVVFQHAQLLHRNRYQVTVSGKGPLPSWAGFEGAYIDLDESGPGLPEQDLVVATYWTTLSTAVQLNLGPVVHFCQGYEGDYPHLAAMRERIECAYQITVPTWVVSPHLEPLLRERFGRVAYTLPPPLDPIFRPALRVGPRSIPWIAVCGVFECGWKGVRTGLEAIRHLREKDQPCRLLRISLLPLSNPEREILEPERFLCQCPPPDVARALRGCDLLLFPSQRVEGFGLSLLEAMASKVPAIASQIPSTEFMGQGRIKLVSADEPAAFASQAQLLLSDPSAWRRARRLGYRASRRFHPRKVLRELEQGIQWALGK